MAKLWSRIPLFLSVKKGHTNVDTKTLPFPDMYTFSLHWSFTCMAVTAIDGLAEYDQLHGMHTSHD